MSEKEQAGSSMLRSSCAQERQAVGGAIARRKSFDPDKDLSVTCRAGRALEAVGSRDALSTMGIGLRARLTEQPEAPTGGEAVPEVVDLKARQAKALARIGDFLRGQGFQGVNQPKQQPFLNQLLGYEQVYPVHVAAEHGDVRLLSLLLLAGADRRTKTSHGRDALDVAAQADRFGSHRGVLGILREP